MPQVKPRPSPVSTTVGVGSMFVGLAVVIWIHRNLPNQFELPANANDVAVRLAYALKWLALPAFTTGLIIEMTALGRVGDLKGFGGNPAHHTGEEPYWFKKIQRAQINTVEQFLMQMATMFTFAAIADERHAFWGDVRLVASLAITFSVGRLLYFFAYAVDPAYRGFPLVLSNFNYNLVVLGWCAWAVIVDFDVVNAVISCLKQ